MINSGVLQEDPRVPAVLAVKTFLRGLLKPRWAQWVFQKTENDIQNESKNNKNTLVKIYSIRWWELQLEGIRSLMCLQSSCIWYWPTYYIYYVVGTLYKVNDASGGQNEKLCGVACYIMETVEAVMMCE